MKNTPAVQRVIDLFNLKGKYITFSVENPLDGQDDVINVSVAEALHEITRNGGKLHNLKASIDIGHKYAAVKGWKVYNHYIGNGSQG